MKTIYTAGTGWFTWWQFEVDHTKTNPVCRYGIQNVLKMSGRIRGLHAIIDRAPAGSLSWLYHLYEFQNGWYLCNQISILNMYNHLEQICPRVPDDITDLMVLILSNYIGLFETKCSKKMRAHHRGDWPAGPPKTVEMLIAISQWISVDFYNCSVKSIFSGILNPFPELKVSLFIGTGLKIYDGRQFCWNILHDSISTDIQLEFKTVCFGKFNELLRNEYLLIWNGARFLSQDWWPSWILSHLSISY